jgi:C-terminal processing protease CtpA/Prc
MDTSPNPFGSFYQGDELLSVNGIDVRGKSAFDVSSMLQGPKETFVTIKVLNNLMNIVFRFV